jgi:hypothetical protein
MEAKQLGRRTVIAAAGASLAPLLPSPAFGQFAVPSSSQVVVKLKGIAPRDAGQLHGERLLQSKEMLSGRSPLSPDGLNLLVNGLYRNKVISNEEAVFVKSLIKQLSESKTVDELQSGIDRSFNSISGQTGAVAAAIIDITRSSMEYIKQQLAGITFAQALNVVFNDLSGALTGAETAAKLGGARIDRTFAAILGAVIGASSTSINAALAIKP